MPETSTYDVSTIGEVLLRLSPSPGDRLADARSVDVGLAGAEVNVCAALAGLGRRSVLCTALPDTDLGNLALRRLRAFGIDTRAIRVSEGERMGVYWAELARAPLPASVIYDRRDSAVTNLRSNDVPWDRLLDTRLLHLTGITPSLGPRCRELIEVALDRAAAAGVPVSLDVNHRAKLWSATEAGRWLDDKARNLELLFCSARDARTLFGATGDPRRVAMEVFQRLRPKAVVLTLGEDGAILHDGRHTHHEPAPQVVVVDRPGAGDALAAGVIDGWLDGDAANGLPNGILMAAMALTQRGDQVVTTRREIAAIATSMSNRVDIQR